MILKTYEQTLINYNTGEYRICIDDLDNKKFRYMIAGKYTGGNVPNGMIVNEFPTSL